MPGFFDPLLPQSAIQPAQEALDKRRLNQSPLEAQIRGFGAGALEGLRGLTSPAQLLGLAGMAVPGGAMARFAPKALQGLSRAAGPTMDLIESSPVAQVAPSMDDVASLIGQMKANMAKIPQAGTMAGRSSMGAEFVPRGSEAAYNASRAASQLPTVTPKYPGVADEMVTKYISRMR